MKIRPDTIERIHQATDIVEVIGDFVSLKKKGQNYWACCPFHHEKSPSFSVTASKGIFKCFGCGKSGDAITFIQEIEGLSFTEALKYLGKKYGIEVEETESTPEEKLLQSERDSLYIVLNYAKNFYKDILHHHEEGQAIGLSYFKERGFSIPTIEKFELGYSREEWDLLLKDANEKGYQLPILEKAGLILARENANDSKSVRHYDRFRGRVIFPIHNVAGKVIAFGARILKSDKNQPKYINSPETEVYHKSKILYGMFQAKNTVRNEDNCYLVEGYTDVISLHQAGIENVVASSGTSLTEDQIKLIKRFTQNITVLYDGDPAGIKASMRGIDMILEQGLNVNVVLFPDNDDPDSYVRKIGGTAFRKYITDAKKDFITFKTELALQEAGNDPVKKANVIRDIVESISKIPDAIKRAVFFKQCSNLLDIDEQTLISEYNKKHLNDRRKQWNEVNSDQITAEQITAPEVVIPDAADRMQSMLQNHEKGVIKLLLNYSSEKIEGEVTLAQFLISELEDVEFQIPVYKRILEIIRVEHSKGNSITETFFINYPEEEIRKEVIDIISNRYEASDNWEKYQIEVPNDKELLGSITPRSVLRLKRVAVKFLLLENLRELREAKDDEQIVQLLTINKQLKQVSDQINGLLGIVVG